MTRHSDGTRNQYDDVLVDYEKWRTRELPRFKRRFWVGVAAVVAVGYGLSVVSSILLAGAVTLLGLYGFAVLSENWYVRAAERAVPSLRVLPGPWRGRNWLAWPGRRIRVGQPHK